MRFLLFSSRSSCKMFWFLRSFCFFVFFSCFASNLTPYFSSQTKVLGLGLHAAWASACTKPLGSITSTRKKKKKKSSHHHLCKTEPLLTLKVVHSLYLAHLIPQMMRQRFHYCYFGLSFCIFSCEFSTKKKSPARSLMLTHKGFGQCLKIILQRSTTPTSQKPALLRTDFQTLLSKSSWKHLQTLVEIQFLAAGGLSHTWATYQCLWWWKRV